MTTEQIYEFLQTNPVCYLATVEGDQPRVRGMMLYKADPTGLLFHTGSMKELCQHMKLNPKVEVCFASQDMQVRIAGMAEFVDDLELKKQIAEDRPFMKPWLEQHGFDFLAVFRVVNCQAAVWTMTTNLEPTHYISI